MNEVILFFDFWILGMHMAFFIIWLILNFSFTTYYELKKKDKKPLPQMEEIIIFDEN